MAQFARSIPEKLTSSRRRRRLRSSAAPSTQARALHRRARLGLAAALIAGLWLAPGRSYAFEVMENRGGPMLTMPEIAPVYIGNWSTDAIDATQAYLVGLVGYLNGKGAPRGRQQVLRQYGVVGASLLPASGPYAGPTTITKGSVASMIRDAQAYGAWGYAPGRIVLALTTGAGSVTLDPGSSGFHDADGTDHIYAYVSDELNGAAFNTQNTISHEIFEAATDPYWHNGFFQDEAWIYWTSEFCFAPFGCWGDTAEGADNTGTSLQLPFGPITTFRDNARFANDGWSTASQPVAGDFDGDGHDDIALAGGYRIIGGGRPNSNVVPIAYSNGAGSFPRVTAASTSYMYLADTDNVTVLGGDFDGDGASDLAFVGGIGWATTPVMFSNRNGTFRFVNSGDATFAAWAQAPGVQAVAGDFNGDHRTDIALAGGPGWTTIPIAFSNGDGTFWVENYDSAGSHAFGGFMATPGAQLIAGKFDRSGLASVGVIGVADQWAMFVKHDGYWFNYSFAYDQTFSEWSSLPGVKAFTGDFDGDGLDDIALAGGPGWASVPIAFTSYASGYQGFRVQNIVQWDFGVWATAPGVTPVAGHFAHPQQSDIALVGGWNWQSVPIDYLAAFPYSGSPPYDTFRYVLNPIVGSNFPTWAQ